MCKKKIKKYLGLSCFLMVLWGGISLSSGYAAEYYVAQKGSASANQLDEGAVAWSDAENLNEPCSAGTAMARATAGDVVYFRGGTYALSHSDSNRYNYTGALSPSNSGTEGNPITFKAYPGELPVLDVSTAESGWDHGVAFGAGCQEYIVFDGFKVVADSGAKLGGMKFQGNNCEWIRGLVVRNCEFDGGSTILTSTDNRECIRVERTEGTIVENCIVYNCRQTDDWHNTSAIKTYTTNGLVVRNCEIYNCSCGIFLKSRANDTLVYNNYVHDCYQGGLLNTYLDRHSNNVSIYNNVIAKCAYRGFTTINEEEATANDLKFFNNTCYSIVDTSFGSGKTTPGHGVVFFNNILQTTDALRRTFRSGYSNDPLYGYIKEADHNQWTTSFKIECRANGTHTYTTLSPWQSSGELEGGGNPGSGSLASDPKFINTSGTMNSLDDFKLASDSPCKGAGRNGEDMGADIDMVGPHIFSAVNSPSDGKLGEKPAKVQEFIADR
jgi:parallel beta-helix repeat protein